MAQKPNRREVLLASGAAITVLSGCTGSVQEGNGDESGDGRSLEWDGQGSEHATQDCPDEAGYWHWILTPGGSESIDEDAELTVDFDDGSSVTVSGYRPGDGSGAVHFDVYKVGGGTVASARVTFSGGGDNTVLTISDGECVPESDIPDDTPLPGDGDDGDNGENGDGDNGDNGDDDDEDDGDDGDGDDGDNGDGDDGDNGDGDDGDNGDDDDGDDGDDGDGKAPKVDLTGDCYKEEKGKARFSVTNHTDEDVTATWKVLGGSEQGTIAVPKHGSETVWVSMATDQKLGLYHDGDMIARAKVNARACSDW